MDQTCKLGVAGPLTPRCLQSNFYISYSNTASPPFTPVATRRISQIFENPEFYVDGAGFSDIIQG